MNNRICNSSTRSGKNSVDDSYGRRNTHYSSCDIHRNRRRRRPMWYTNSNNDVVSASQKKVSSSSRHEFFLLAAAALLFHLIPGDHFNGTMVYCYSTASHRFQRPSYATHPPVMLQNMNNNYWRKNGGLSFRERSSRRFVLTTPEAIIEQASTTKLLDDLIDESVRTSARRPLMMQFDPSSGWIWKRWKGTVFSETWDACVYRMIYACIVFLLCKSFPQTKELLSGFAILWGQLLSVTTFTLTFFVNQSYALWRKCSELSRSLQGRLHDMDMTLAAHATRMPSKNAGETSRYTSESKQILEVVSRYVRLFNLLTYASFTRSHRPVLTPRGMRRLVERGLMTPLEREVLVNAKLPATQRHNAVLLWILRTFIEGTKAGHFTGGAGFEQQFIEKAHVCRSAYGAIGDELQGRMPLAYAHIVQVLVDLVLALYPFMAYSAGMSGFVCVIGTGLLTIGYQGLVWFSTINIMRSYEVENFSSPIKLADYLSQADLAKQFLDPYDNENYGKGEDPLVVDTLIAETNAGSTRWMDGLAEMPVASQKIIDGELSEYILPRRGYTVEELQQMLEEQKLLKEKRDKEELERQKKKEQEEREKSWSEAMIPALMVTNRCQHFCNH
jgi:Bestrophin, RFP-TM, chloride channel